MCACECRSVGGVPQNICVPRTTSSGYLETELWFSTRIPYTFDCQAISSNLNCFCALLNTRNSCHAAKCCSYWHGESASSLSRLMQSTHFFPHCWELNPGPHVRQQGTKVLDANSMGGKTLTVNKFMVDCIKDWQLSVKLLWFVLWYRLYPKLPSTLVYSDWTSWSSCFTGVGALLQLSCVGD